MLRAPFELCSIKRTARVIRAKRLGRGVIGAGEMLDTCWSVSAANWMLNSSHGRVAEPASPAQAREISEDSPRRGGKRSTGKYNFTGRNPASAAILCK